MQAHNLFPGLNLLYAERVLEIARKQGRQKKKKNKQQSKRKKVKAVENDIAKRQQRLSIEKQRAYIRTKYPKIGELIETPGFIDWYNRSHYPNWSEWSWFEIEGRHGLLSTLAAKKREEELENIREKTAREYLLRIGRGDQSSMRGAILALASPAWANYRKIDEIYKKRDILNEKYPDHAPFHVDHIIPIMGKNVTGLHTHENLRVIPASENQGKRNRFYDLMLTDPFCWTSLLR